MDWIKIEEATKEQLSKEVLAYNERGYYMTGYASEYSVTWKVENENEMMFGVTHIVILTPPRITPPKDLYR